MIRGLSSARCATRHRSSRAVGVHHWLGVATSQLRSTCGHLCVSFGVLCETLCFAPRELVCRASE